MHNILVEASRQSHRNKEMQNELTFYYYITFSISSRSKIAADCLLISYSDSMMALIFF